MEKFCLHFAKYIPTHTAVQNEQPLTPYHEARGENYKAPHGHTSASREIVIGERLAQELLR